MGKISPFEILGETYVNAFRWAHYFLPIALVIAVIGAVFNVYFMESLFPNPGAVSATALPENFWTVWAVLMPVMLAVQLIQISLFDAIMDRKAGWFSFGIKRALWRAIPALVGMVIYMLAYLVGALLLVIPGLMVLFLLYMMMPLILLDGVGPFEAVRKSWQLTWGNAWRLLGAILLTFLPMMLVFWPAGIALGYLFVDPQQMATASLPSWSDWQAWVWTLLTSITGVLFVSFYLVTFRALKAARSGDGEAVSDLVTA